MINIDQASDVSSELCTTPLDLSLGWYIIFYMSTQKQREDAARMLGLAGGKSLVKKKGKKFMKKISALAAIARKKNNKIKKPRAIALG